MLNYKIFLAKEKLKKSVRLIFIRDLSLRRCELVWIQWKICVFIFLVRKDQKMFLKKKKKKKTINC